MENFVEELRWRGMIHQDMPGTEEALMEGMTAGYVGFDPTAVSLHVGNLIPIMMLVHFQRSGHKPYALVGGATGMIGDPSGKSAERNLLSEEILKANQEGVRKQLEQFLDFECGENSAEIVNNYDWFREMDVLSFLRDVGKHLTVNYMMAKESVKKRIETGISFTEFSYQLIQGYDYYYLYKNKNCKIQMGGSDQWGNITSGTELIRRMGQGEAYALTCKLLTKADGSKFGKSEGGNIWLDPNMTTPYQFYQFWLNTADDDVYKFIRIFSLLPKEEIEALEKAHDVDPSKRILQEALAKDVTSRVHSVEEYEKAFLSSKILFGNKGADLLKELSAEKVQAVFNGVPHFKIAKSEIESGMQVISFLSTTGIYSSNGEARRALKANAVAVNKVKVNESKEIGKDDLLAGDFIVVQKGKKVYNLVELVD